VLYACVKSIMGLLWCSRFKRVYKLLSGAKIVILLDYNQVVNIYILHGQTHRRKCNKLYTIIYTEWKKLKYLAIINHNTISIKTRWVVVISISFRLSHYNTLITVHIIKRRKISKIIILKQFISENITY